MRRVLDMMGSALAATWEALLSLLGDGRVAPYLGAALLLAALLLLLSLLPRRRRSRGAERPDVLLSQGEIVTREEDDALMLHVTVSNLNPYPLQLLELSVRMSDLPAPLTTDVAAMIAPQGIVELTAELENVEGDEGALELYVYAGETRRKTFRVTAQLLWEPWNGRYKLSPLGQRVDAVKALASTRHHREQLASWRRQMSASGSPGRERNPVLDDVFSTLDETADDAISANGEAAPERRTRDDREERDARGGPKVPLDFPSDF